MMRLTCVLAALAMTVWTHIPARASFGASPAGETTTVVSPIGQFPADVTNVQAALDRGGTAFNFGDFSGPSPPITDDEFLGSGGVFVTTDVEIAGETLPGARTTIIGGRNVIRASDLGGIAVRAVHFAGPRMHAIFVTRAARVEITGNRFADLRPVLLFPALGLTFALAAQSYRVGSVTVTDNVVDGVIVDDGQR